LKIAEQKISKTEKIAEDYIMKKLEKKAEMKAELFKMID